MNLILAEMLVSLFGIPVDALASAQGGWNMGATLCITVGFVLTTLGMFHSLVNSAKYSTSFPPLKDHVLLLPSGKSYVTHFISLKYLNTDKILSLRLNDKPASSDSGNSAKYILMQLLHV